MRPAAGPACRGGCLGPPCSERFPRQAKGSVSQAPSLRPGPLMEGHSRGCNHCGSKAFLWTVASSGPGLSNAPVLPVDLPSPWGLSSRGLKDSDQLCLKRGWSAAWTPAAQPPLQRPVGVRRGPLVREAGALVHQGVGVQPRPAAGCPGHRVHGRPGGGGAGRGAAQGERGAPSGLAPSLGPICPLPSLVQAQRGQGCARGHTEVVRAPSSGQSPEVPPRPAGAGGQSLKAEVRALGGGWWRVPTQLVNHHAGKGFHFLSLACSVFLLPRKSAGYDSLFSTFAMADNG